MGVLFIKFNDAKIHSPFTLSSNGGIVYKNDLISLSEYKLSNDKIIVCGKKNEKGEKFSTFQKYPIGLSQVSNLLHVLMGERPVPKNRKVLWNRVEWIHELAKNALVYLEPNGIIKKNKINYYGVNTELTQKAKGAYNSKSTSNHINWFTLKNYINDDVIFSDYIEFLKNVTGLDDPQKIPFMDVFYMIYNDESNYNDKTLKGDDLQLRGKLLKEGDIFNNKHNRFKIITNSIFLNVRNLTSFYDMKTTGSYFLRKRNIRSIGYLWTFDGMIYVPMTDEESDSIVKNFATILDGGVAKIVKYLSDGEVDTDYYIERDASIVTDEMINYDEYLQMLESEK